MKNMLLFIFIFIGYFFKEIYLVSTPSVNPSNPNFVAGLNTLVSSGALDNNLQTYQFTIANALPTNSIKTAIGIVMNQMSLIAPVIGFDLKVISSDATQIFIDAYALSSTNSITKLKICYMTTAYVELHVDYYMYTFNSLTDTVLNYSLTDTTTCPYIYDNITFLQCRSKTIGLPYAPIGNTMKAIAVISGFTVNSFKTGVGTNPVFGVGLINQVPGTSSLSVNVIVYGRALLSTITAYYISYEYQVLNIYGDKVLIMDVATVGCVITYGTPCLANNLLNSNPTITTVSTSFNVYYSTNYFYGFSNYISNFASGGGYGMNFAVGATSLSGTAYQSGFVYSGNSDMVYRMQFRYLIILQFYCPNTGTDIYYSLNSNTCNSTCNATFLQYPDANRKCQLCDPVCYQCSGASNLCDSCYTAHHRIISGDSCICNPIGYYDDGTSLTCPSCHYSCRSCTGPSASQCIDCISANHRTIDINSCFCDVRFYDDGASQSCLACHYTCYTCSSSLATNCLTCSAADFRQVLSTNNSCPCIIGYYDKGSPNNVCGLCHYTCYTCLSSSSSACLTCDLTNQFRLQSGWTCPCTTGYYDNLNPVCAICHVTCLKCNGPTKFDCISCDNTKFRALQSGQCKCKTGYYDYNNTCYLCDYTCFNCTGATKTECVNCNSAVSFRTFLGINNSCYCNSGYCDIGINQCTKCDRTCLTCQNASTICLTCDATKNRQPAGNTCPCLFGYVDTVLVSGLCSKCHYSCLTCTGTASTQCQTCDTAWRTLSSGSCLCNTHTYDDGIHSQCYPCNQQCVECSAQYDTTCKTCDITFFRQLVGIPPKPCTCIQRYFENNNALMCDICHFSCLTCSVISTNCTSCDSAINHRYASGTSCLCQTHYYQINAQSCSICLITCQNCSVNPNNCTSCYSDRYLSSNKCLCNLGTYEDVFLACQPCHYSCKTCQNSSTTCLTCPVFTYRTINSASCPCDFGYYDNNVAVCAKCSYQCNGCTGPSPPKCIACPVSSLRTLQPDNSCPCDVGYYDDGSSPTCKLCKNTCSACTAYSVCTACFPVSSQFRSLSSNDCKCIAGYYDNLINPVCQTCHYSCATCFGALDTNCYTCKPNRAYQVGSSSCPCQAGFYQSSQICYSCDMTCKTCFGVSTNCTGCDITIRYLMSNQCYCREGYFENGGVCTACNLDCGSCNFSASYCLTCNPNQFTILSGTSCICPPGQYKDAITLVCMSCNLKCLTCSNFGQTSCLTCASTSHRTFNSITNSCDCDPGYIDQGLAVCNNCHSSCMTCYGPTQLNCSSCYAGVIKIGSSCRIPTTCTSGYYFEGYCVTLCPNSTYPRVNICQTCIKNCKTCISSTVCTSCQFGFYFNSTAQTCNINCNQGSYINRVNATCDHCPTGCEICYQRNGTVNCPKCLLNYYLYNHTTCVDSIFCSIPNYIIVGLQCYPCQYPCQTCNSIAFDGCLSCKTNFSLYNGQCLSICPLGYYSYNQVCLQCQTRCKQCSATRCQQCNDGFYLTPDEYNPKCVTNSYFFNPSTGQEEKCHINCQSCTNSSFSSCISCQKFRGDESQMAISGYCECWQDSMDIGLGQCSFSAYQNVQTYTKVLKSSTDSALYTAGVASVFSGNFLASGIFMIYQQSYSTLYFINTSSVLQTDQYLKQALDKNFNFYLNNRISNPTDSKVHYSRLLVTLQTDMSLFSRGNEFELYLFSWAFYTVVIIVATWIMILIANCILRCKCVIQSQMCKTIFMTIKSLLQQSAIIIIHLLTISEISLYATVTFKLIIQNNFNLQINWIKFGLSVALAAYYLIYIFRLIIGCYRIGRSTDLQSKYQYNPLRLLVLCFEISQAQQNNKIKNIKSKSPKKVRFADLPLMKKLYIPFLMLRLALGSVLMIYFSNTPLIQVGSVLGLMFIWIIYSLICCPYPKFFKIFIHLNQIVYLVQIGMILYSVISGDDAQLTSAYIQLILNGIQIGSMFIFSILLAFRLVYGICQQTKNNSNRISNIYTAQQSHQNNNSELYLNEKGNSQLDDIKSYELNENVFDQQLIGENLDETKPQDLIKSYQLNKSININECKKKQKVNKSNIQNQSNQNEQNKTVSNQDQQDKVIIKKKYRAVRRNRNN